MSDFTSNPKRVLSFSFLLRLSDVNFRSASFCFTLRKLGGVVKFRIDERFPSRYTITASLDKTRLRWCDRSDPWSSLCYAAIPSSRKKEIPFQEHYRLENMLCARRLLSFWVCAKWIVCMLEKLLIREKITFNLLAIFAGLFVALLPVRRWAQQYGMHIFTPVTPSIRVIPKGF